MKTAKYALWILGGAIALTGGIMLINKAITSNGGSSTIPNPLLSAANRARLALKIPMPGAAKS